MLLLQPLAARTSSFGARQQSQRSGTGLHGSRRLPSLQACCSSSAGAGRLHGPLHGRTSTTDRSSHACSLHGASAAPRNRRAEAMRGRPTQAAAAEAVAAMTSDSLTAPFLWANSAITYSWLLLILAPRWELTKAVFKSDAVVVLLCTTFLYFFIAASAIDTSSSEDLTAKATFLFTEAITDPAKMATLATPAYIAQDWIHLLVWDFVVGLYIWKEALEQDLPVRHSLLCIFTFGPAGLLVHLLTKAVVGSWRKRQVQL